MRTFTDRHGLKYLLNGTGRRRCVETTANLGLGLGQSCSDAQKEYAASDVLYLHKLKAALEAILIREDRLDLAQRCFDFLPTRAELDLLGWEEPNDLFHH